MAETDTQQTLPRPLVERLVAVALVFGLAGGAMGGFLWQRFSGSSDSRSLVVQENAAIIEVVKKVSPSVVSITSETAQESFFGTQSVTDAGTGIIISDNGLIITNKHVVPRGVGSVSVFTADGREHTGRVVGRDSANDLALVRIKATGLTPAELGDSSTIQIGQKVIAIGNALGQFQNSVTTGIISAIGRPLEAGDGLGTTENLQNLLQTDAAINPGNSGGPLVDLEGKVIGINTAIAGDAENIGFSIPINEARPVIDSFIREGRIVRAFLGVRFIPISKEFAAARDLPVSEGAYLNGEGMPAVIARSPAARAGLKAGDIITKVNQDAVNVGNSLTALIGRYKPGDKVTLTVLRGKKTLTVQATLTEAP